jgi:hypothetical protein
MKSKPVSAQRHESRDHLATNFGVLPIWVEDLARSPVRGRSALRLRDRRVTDEARRDMDNPIAANVLGTAGAVCWSVQVGFIGPQ